MEISELVKIVKPYSMATEERLTWIAQSAKQVIDRNIPGDFVECGVCNGGSAAILAHYAAGTERRVHLFDSWQGLPSITREDVPSVSNHPAEKEVGKCVGDPEKVREVLSLVKADANRTYMHEGWFNETFPLWCASINQIAMLNLDSDWYSSEKLCWNTWYDKVSIGGFIYVDDYYYWPGCRYAADQFFHDRKRTFGGVGTDPVRIGHSLGLEKIQ